MVSDFIEEHGGYLCLSVEQLADARRQNHGVFPRQARVLLEFQRDGYWNGDKFMKNVETAVQIAGFKYPKENFDLVWVFDHSSGHMIYAKNALRARLMNVKPGGGQPRMRPGRLPDGREQLMVFHDGTPKGLEVVLQERGINTTHLNRCEMVKILEEFPDFKYEKPMVQTFLEERGHKCLFNPKVRTNQEKLNV